MPLWRGDLSPLGREAPPKPATPFIQANRVGRIATAAQPNGDKSPRHRECAGHRGHSNLSGRVVEIEINHRNHPG
ncbi:hypothetical protein DJ564_00295 [Pseudomonas sp. 31-12]|nr:hypothetical protein DJ564_00295 [Pseudomonas sp. 31-12]